MSCPWRPASLTSAAAASSERSRAGGAGRVTGSTGPGAPYAPGPARLPTPRPSVSRSCSPTSATLRLRPAWGVYQRPVPGLPEDPGLGRFLVQRLISSLGQAVPDGLEEIQALARTLTERAADILAYLDHPHTSNAPHARRSTGAWSTYAASPWDLRNLASYTIRSLIHAGRLKDHLAATT